MTLIEAKAYLAHSWVLHPEYRPENSPQHNLYEPVNVRLTFSHWKHEQAKGQA